MLLGAIIRKFGFLHLQSINDITNIALYFLSPMVILKAFQQYLSAGHKGHLYFIYQDNDMLDDMQLFIRNAQQLQDTVHLVGKVEHEEC